jgi:acetyl esterase
VIEPGLVHGYLRARHMSARARASFARIVDAIRNPDAPA